MSGGFCEGGSPGWGISVRHAVKELRILHGGQDGGGFCNG